MSRTVTKVETFVVTVPRDTPYLGPLGPGEHLNARGYVVRKGNGTIYPSVDRSVAVRITCADGSEGRDRERRAKFHGAAAYRDCRSGGPFYPSVGGELRRLRLRPRPPRGTRNRSHRPRSHSGFRP